MTPKLSKNALVIGATGLLGRGVAVELLAAGWQVVVISRGHNAIPAELAGHEHLIADRCNSASMSAAMAGRMFDVIVDCAAYTAEDARVGIENFAGRTRHYFFISTDFVYAPDPATQFPVNEDAPKLNGLPYATGKLEAEAILLEAFRNNSLPLTILRPPHILGAGRAPGCDPIAGGRDARLVKRLREGEVIPLLAEGQFLIQPVWSREIGRAVAALAGKSHTMGAILNTAGSECVTVRHYYEILAELIGVPLNVWSVNLEEFCRESPEKAHLARHRIYDTGRLKEAGYTPSQSLRTAMSETLEWLEPQ